MDIGLLSSLPVYWAESENLADMLQPEQEIPWPRQLIEQRHRLVPLDSLAGPAGVARVQAVILAQPRPLSAEENVALDDWVRAGGQALVFADPMLTAESRFSIGDRRRPQDVALLSPILARWGMALEFDEDQPAGERLVEDPVAGPIPVHLAGRLRAERSSAAGEGECRFAAEGLVARCAVGLGSVTVVADAALLENAEGDASGQRAAALTRLVDSLAAPQPGTRRANAGSGAQKAGEAAAGAQAEGQRSMINNKIP